MTTGSEKPFGGTRPAKVVFADFLDTFDDTVKHSGTNFPKWNRQDVAGYHAPACGVKAREDGNQYMSQLEGGPIEDPKAAVEAMKSHWEAKRYTIGNIFDESETTPGKGVQISATTPNGVVVLFSASMFGSHVKVQSDCTLDPLAKETTTETVPLGETVTASLGSVGS